LDETEGRATKQFFRATKPFRACCAKSLKPSPPRVPLDEAADRSTIRMVQNKGHPMVLTFSKFGRCKLLVATTLMLGMLTTVSQAYTLEQQEMCTGDALRLCSSEIPDVGRITACMERQRESLSDRCKAVFETDRPAAAPQASASDKPAAKLAKPLTITPKFKHG
jgi:hypothetical protein